jgi:hypothetical protein
VKRVLCILIPLTLLIGLVGACDDTDTSTTPPPESGPPNGQVTPTAYTKSDLLEALKDLEQAMLDKIDSDIEITALAFTDVKDYWRSKRWADILRAPLRVIEGTLNILSTAADLRSLTQQANTSLNKPEATYQVLSTILMLNDLQEVGGKLYHGLDGPTYVSSIEKMLEAADATYIPPIDRNWREYYKKVIENHLWGVAEDTPLIIPRKSTTVERRNAEIVNGALDVRTSINRTFNNLIAEIESADLPSDFPTDEVVAQLVNLRQEVTRSRSWQTNDILYETYLQDGDEYTKHEVYTSLGAVGGLYSFLGDVAGNLDKQLEIEMYVEGMKAASAVESTVLLYSSTYKIEGLAETIKTSQKVFLLSEIIIEGTHKTFEVDAEDEYYILPQEMVLSLPVEISNLWMIADDTDTYLRYLLAEPTTTPTPELTQSSNFEGNWMNENPDTRSITRVTIRSESTNIFIHMWGKCHPTDCDWGEEKTEVSDAGDGVLSITWNESFCIRRQELTLVSARRLKVVGYTHFTDNSGRPDYESIDFFLKE